MVMGGILNCYCLACHQVMGNELERLTLTDDSRAYSILTNGDYGVDLEAHLYRINLFSELRLFH